MLKCTVGLWHNTNRITNQSRHFPFWAICFFCIHKFQQLLAHKLSSNVSICLRKPSKGRRHPPAPPTLSSIRVRVKLSSCLFGFPDVGFLCSLIGPQWCGDCGIRFRGEVVKIFDMMTQSQLTIQSDERFNKFSSKTFTRKKSSNFLCLKHFLSVSDWQKKARM